ncbi:transmembrane sensor [Pedobacter africanus]|uniref:Ferric-dicitrate binding protein FerR (Iron transport regulator) n=1 Tax=Pedobacter africanus TaxID=151894 RepID=A0ACC6L1A9_9SPHI|nr:FecR domain-containing protein [Pedobacter africanus]MDR6785271.1 ferric-dicitrate binding protein FerR (iron transport regulator) [Pedobacter africanus]
MNEPNLHELLQKLHNGSITETEKVLLEAWYNQYAAQSSNVMAEEDLERSVSALRKKLKFGRKPFVLQLWSRIAVASAVACVVIGVYFFRSGYNRDQKSNPADLAVHINPGKNGATLTLADGQKIFINDALTGNIANQSGVKISKTKDGQLIYEVTEQVANKAEYNTLTTTAGQQTRVRLPDGSLVFLNSASSLKYPTSFAKGKERQVSLTGEGYFEIAKDKKHPFIVATTRQEVEVLGTHFNINAYPDEMAVKTTLIEGSVKVVELSAVGAAAAVNNITSQVLKPGQQSILDQKGMRLTKVNIDEAIAWQKGYFRFYDEDITSVMRKISRWYNVEVAYSGALPEVAFNARITKYSSINDVLEALEKTKAVHFKIEGRKVIVSK